jgi:hypothetical protein
MIDFAFNVDNTYMIVITDKLLSIYLSGVLTFTLYLPEITESMIADLDWTQSADTLLLFHEDLATLKIVRYADNDWRKSSVLFENIPTYDFGGITYGSITVTPSATSGSVSLTASSSLFTADMVGWVYRSFDHNGYARITGYTSGTVVTALIVDTLVSAVASSDYALEEPVWSSTRGYIRHGCFHQNRLYVDGGKSRKSVCYGSVVNGFFNFNFGTALDDQAIGPLGGNEFNPIINLYSSTSLMVFTSGGEYIAPQNSGEPLTPTNANLLQQSKIGSQENIRPQEADGGIIYVQRGATSLQEFIYDDTQRRYANNLISLLSNHLIDGITMSALRKATSADDGAYLLLVRSDGGLVVGNILARQNITSFTLQTTDGNFKACGVDSEDMYFAVTRNINGADVQYLERFRNDVYVDCASVYTTGFPTDTFSGLDYIEGESVKCIADGNIMDDETVTAGSLTISRDAETSFQCGFNFTPTITDLPVENDKLGSVYGMKVNISEITLDLHQTKHITVNGKEVSFRGFGTGILDAETPSFTGRKRMVGWRGWDDTGQITISQTYPLPFTLLAITKRVNV